MPTTDIAYKIDPFPSEEELQPMWQAAWGNAWSGDLAFILTRSLVHACAYSDDRLVGYVNVAWDGGVHAFLLDTTVDPAFQRRRIATELVASSPPKPDSAAPPGSTSTTNPTSRASTRAADFARRQRD